MVFLFSPLLSNSICDCIYKWIHREGRYAVHYIVTGGVIISKWYWHAFIFHCEGTIFSGHRCSRWCHWQHACKVSSTADLQPLQENTTCGMFFCSSRICVAFPLFLECLYYLLNSPLPFSWKKKSMLFRFCRCKGNFCPFHIIIS